MARHLVKGQAAFMRSIAEQGRYVEVMEEKDRLLGEGHTHDECWRILVDMAKFQPPVNMEHEDAVLELDKLAKSGKSGSITEIIMWVAKNVGNSRAKEGDTPDPIAWTYHKFLQDNPNGQGEFWKWILPKLMPSTRELDNQARYSDDGSTEIELAERILARMTENVA